jgi:hypothetical protein
MSGGRRAKINAAFGGGLTYFSELLGIQMRNIEAMQLASSR